MGDARFARQFLDGFAVSEALLTLESERAGRGTQYYGRNPVIDAHFTNFIAGIRKREKVCAPISVNNIALTMLQHSNIAWEVNRGLHPDSKDGKNQGDAEAMKM